MAKKKTFVLITTGVLLITIIAAAILIKMSYPNHTVGPNGELDNSLSSKITDKNNSASSDSAQINEPVPFIVHLKYPFSTNNEGLNLTNEQLDENLEDLKEQYENYIKSCDSEELKTLAKNAYDWNIKNLESIKQIKAADPEDLKKSHEIAFYESYNNIIKRCSNPEENGLRPEHAKEMKDTAERAKKYYEEGVITIEQACQAIELGSPSLPYDPTFSLPD